MTQIKLRSFVPRGISAAVAWEYAMRVDNARASVQKRLENKEQKARDVRAKITLPHVKWLDRDNNNV